jgi:lipopolysaccharide heptosyltransferase II
VTLLTSARGAEAAALLECVDEVIAYEAPWMKASEVKYNGAEDRCFARKLRHRRFDGAVIFTCFSQSPLPAAMLCHLSDVPLSLAHCRENSYQLLTHWVRECEPEQGIRHEVRRQLDLVAEIDAEMEDDAIQLTLPRSAVDFAIEQLADVDIEPTRPWIVMHVGASAASRRWPVEYFAEAADEIVAAIGVHIVFTGSLGERELVNDVRRRMRSSSQSLAGRLNVIQLAGLLSITPLLVSNNTGPVHIASGLRTPVVDIYALTNPQHTPWRTPSRVLSHDVPCRNCFRSICPEQHHRCLRGVLPGEVVQAAVELWHATVRAPMQPAGVAF